ncbi:hypothetical protein [Bradyrhizobium sp. Leo121]|uniref:hypothetical protein n=1 Tax=Bradyrhizobium sp. Leo121 TaxID=1571195 RepID=UPI001FE00623|nr:hypothetical protein [Bradyrhizobium sp. Leo121]
MRKLSYVLAALATIAVAAPTVASAQGFSVRIGSDRDYYRDRDYYGPRGMTVVGIADGIVAMTTVT